MLFNGVVVIVDSIDIKIVELLARNARLDNKEIAKEVGTSDRTVARRIKNLEDAGIIEGYTIKIGIGQHEFTAPKSHGERLNTSVSEWESLRNSLTNIFGSGSAMILQCIGYGIGKDLGEKIKSSGLEKGGQCLTFSQTLREKGWGRADFESIDFQEEKGKLFLFDSPFKEAGKELSCYELKGMIAGFLETVFNKKLRVVEEKCVRKGDDHCEFIFSGEREHGH